MGGQNRYVPVTRINLPTLNSSDCISEINLSHKTAPKMSNTDAAVWMCSNNIAVYPPTVSMFAHRFL